MKWEFDKERKNRLNKEKSLVKLAGGGDVRFALVYPGSYFKGMSGLGFQIIYYLLNNIPGVLCERFFSYDKKLDGIDKKASVFSLESGKSLNEFHIIGFSVSFELDYSEILRLLSSSGIPLYSSQRDFTFPLIIAGGPFSFYNPEPLAPFFDVIVLGEAEETLKDLMNVVMSKDFSDKETLLGELSKIEGLYIPSFYSTSPGLKISPHPSFKRQSLENLNILPSHSSVLTENTEFGEMFLVEVARGCKNRCGFCMVGNCFKPYRERTLDTLKKYIESARTLTDRIGLLAPSVTEYKFIDELCTYITDSGMKLSFSSLRADKVTDNMLTSLAASGQKTITLAPETGNNELRRKCFKNIEDEAYLSVIERSLKLGIKNFKFYFMIGLPDEKQEDVKDIITFIENTNKILKKENGKIFLSINQFIPKPGTKFERLPLEPMESISDKIKILKTGMKKFTNLKMKIESEKWSFVQALLALGDRDISKIIFLTSQEEQENFQTWRKAFNDSQIDINSYVYRIKDGYEILPWNHITDG